MTWRSSRHTAAGARISLRPHATGRARLRLGLLALVAAAIAPATAWAQQEPEPAAAPPPAASPAPVTAPPLETPATPPPATEPPTTTPATTTTTTTTTTEPPATDDHADFEGTPTQGGRRVLKHHVFIAPATFGSSFVTTHIGVRARVGTTIAPNLPTNTGSFDIETTTLAETLDFGLKVTDWLGLFVTGGVRTLIGSNLRALVYDGATYDLGGQGGLLARLVHSERSGTQLSLRAMAGYTSGRVATLLPVFEQAIPGGDPFKGELSDAVRTPFTTFNYGAGFAFAQSFGRLFGLQAYAGLGGGSLSADPYDRATGRRVTSTAKSVTYALGVAPSFDFNAFHVPIAVVPEYVLSRAASSAQIRGGGDFDTLHNLSLGVYYSGRKTLQVGLIGSAQRGARGLESAQGRSDTLRNSATELVLRYVW